MFLEDGDGNLWIAASDGLYCYEKKTHEVKEYNVVNSGMPGNIVYSICIDCRYNYNKRNKRYFRMV